MQEFLFTVTTKWRLFKWFIAPVFLKQQCVKQWATDNFQSSSKDKWLECTGVLFVILKDSPAFVSYSPVLVFYSPVFVFHSHTALFSPTWEIQSHQGLRVFPRLCWNFLEKKLPPHLATDISYRLFKITWSRFSPRSSSTRFVSFLKAFGWTSRILQYWTKIFCRLVISSWNNVTASGLGHFSETQGVDINTFLLD